MKHKYLLKIAICLFLISNISFGQTTIVSNGFEGGDTWTVSSGSPSVNSDAGASDTPSNSRIKSGTKSWTINNGTETVEFTSQSVTGKTDVKILVYLSSTAGTSGNGADSSDYLKVWANVNGGGFPATADIEIKGNSNARWDYSGSLTATTAAGTNISLAAPQSGTNANNYATLEITIPDGSTSVALKIEGKNNSGNEYWNIDDVTLVGETASSDPTVGFDSASSSVNETDLDIVTSGIPISFTNWDTSVTITPTVNGSSTAEPSDYTIDLTPIVFGANETKSIPLTIHDDADMDGETIIIDFTVTSGTADLGTSTHTVTINDDDLPDVVISEIMYNTNTPGSDDEWIELYNDDGSSVDINGWTLDYGSSSYTFSSSTIIPSKGYITIAVGSNNSGNDYKFNADFPFEPDFNTLGHTYYDLVTTTAGGDTNKLTNSSATITLKDASTTTIDTVTYDDGHTDGNHDGDGNSLEIVDVDADNSSTSSNWRTSSNLGGSPGASITSTWSGATSSVWNLAGNWDNGIPTSTINAIIPVTANQPTAAAAATANKVIINSQATLIANASFTGTVTYQRNLGSTNWYLVSSPVSGEIMTDMRANNSFNTNGSSEISFSPYDNSQAIANDRWAYFGDTATDALVNGKGYSTSLASSGDISFTGTLNTMGVTIGITQGGGSGTNFNLLGNPFTSYINSATFLMNESDDLDTQAIWLWDQSGNGGAGEYVTKVTGDNFKIAPGQGFFVEASSTNNVTFTETMQSHESTDTFQRNGKTEIHLYMNDGTNNKFAKLYYIDGTTTGFDNGYDGKLFNGVSNPFAIYTHLVSNSQGKNYQIQSLPKSNYENMIIPVGVNAASGKELTFSAETMNIPSGIKVYLEDKNNNSFTRLDEVNSEYKVTLDNDLNGIGRFYIHTTSSVLNTPSFDISTIGIYKTSTTNLRVAGLQNGKANVNLFNVLGKKVFETSFTANSVNDINLPVLKTGIYIVQLTTEQGKINKKIIIE